MVDVVDVVVVVVQGWLLVGCIVVLVSNLTLSKGAPDMNHYEEQDATPTPDFIASLMQQTKQLAEELGTTQAVLQRAKESLESYKREREDLKESVTALAHKHVKDTDEFYNEIIELFDIELTKTVTVQYTVSVEVQATVPASMTTEEVEEELASAKLDYEFLGNGDIEIDGFDFGDLEVE